MERKLTGSTPLYVACWGGMLGVVQLLVAFGADRKHVNYFGLRANDAVRDDTLMIRSDVLQCVRASVRACVCVFVCIRTSVRPCARASVLVRASVCDRFIAYNLCVFPALKYQNIR